MNAHAERFNRTIQEEFVDFHEAELLNPIVFNASMTKHLMWHNIKRPHWSLGLVPHITFIQRNFPQECKR
jgi:transposase InsO family protein